MLSAILRQDSTAEQVTLMHKLVGLSDEERDRLIDEFWTEASAGWEPPERMVEWWRAARPELPDHPTAAQLEAWIELAELVRDAEVRQAVRRELHEACTTGAGPLMTSSPMLDALEAGAAIGQPVKDAAREQVPPDSPRGRTSGWPTHCARPPCLLPDLTRTGRATRMSVPPPAPRLERMDNVVELDGVTRIYGSRRRPVAAGPACRCAVERYTSEV